MICNRCDEEKGDHFYKSHRQCKDCIREYKRVWSAKRTPEQKEAKRAYYRQWSKDNPDKVRAKHLNYMARPEVYRDHLAYQRKYRKNNRSWVNAYYAGRKALENNAPGNATAEQIKQRWAMFGDKCWMCGKPAVETDHVIPLTRGGSNWPANLRPSCRSCNARKNNRKLVLG